MSLLAMRSVWELALADWPPTRRLVALALADFVNDDEGDAAWPSLAHLSAMCGLGERMTQYHLRALEAAGWIERQPRFVASQQRSNVWLWKMWIGRLAAVDGPGREGPDGCSGVHPLVQLIAPLGVKPIAPLGVQPAAPRSLSRTTTGTTTEPLADRAATRRAHRPAVDGGQS